MSSQRFRYGHWSHNHFTLTARLQSVLVDLILSQPSCLAFIHVAHRYDGNHNCSFGKDRLHFAVHVRMGDRQAFLDGNLEYFQLLERIMKVIAAEVANKGLPKPLFHIFSETLAPCPSEETGLFDEFPTWPVSLDQVRKTSITHANTAGGLGLVATFNAGTIHTASVTASVFAHVRHLLDALSGCNNGISKPRMI